eukprot:GHVN01041561.1.p1 GENE.GHVN01041561.1~~GHVN01041561.1.p1  ORF type:complete len:209 (-),score=12.96 GHVN01041561.1:272-898(-)
MPESSTGGRAILIGDYIYIFGAGPGNNRVLRLTLSTRRWSLRADMPFRNIRPIVASIGAKVFLIFNQSTANLDHAAVSASHDIEAPVYCFDTASNTWSAEASLSERFGVCTEDAVAFGVKDTQIYLVGGVDKLCMRYSVESKKWAICSKKPKYFHSTGVYLDGRIYLCGVERVAKNTGLYHRYIEMYSFNKKSNKRRWTAFPDAMPVI